MAMRKLSYGMVGGDTTAFIGNVHRSAIRMNNNADLVAGCFSSNAEKQNYTCEFYDIEGNRNYSNYHEMAQKEAVREDKIDFVIIATPNSLHYPVAKLFLANGIHVVCEKPLCFTPEEGYELKKTADENGCLFGVTYTYLGHVMTREARALVQGGAIGRVRMVLGEYLQDGKQRAKLAGNTSRGWRSNPELSGPSGTTADVGTHIDSWVSYVTGESVESLICSFEYLDEASLLDCGARILVEYSGGLSGVFYASQAAAGYDNYLKITLIGELGSIEYEPENCNYLKLMKINEPVQILSRGKPYMSKEALGDIRMPSGHPEGLVEAFANIYRDFATAIYDKLQGKAVVESDYAYPTIDMGIKGVEFFNMCIESHNNNSLSVHI